MSTVHVASVAHTGATGLPLTVLKPDACASCVCDDEREAAGGAKECCAKLAHVLADARVAKVAVATCVSHLRSVAAPVATLRPFRQGALEATSCSARVLKLVMSASAALSLENIPMRDAGVSAGDSGIMSPPTTLRSHALFDAAIMRTSPHSLDTPNCGTP